MKEKLIKILTVASLSVASLAAVVGVAISHGMKSLSSINADDTRYIEIKAEDIRDAIGAGSEGNFTIAGIGFHVNGASYSEGKANINGGILETTVTAGQSVNPENNMMGNGYQSMAILDKESASGGNLMTKDDSNALIAEHPFGAETQALYELDFSADNLTKKVSNLFVAFGASGGTSFSSIKFYYTCKEAPTSHTVTFMNGEDVYDTQEVEDGDLAVAPATDPTKDPDVSAPKYRFKGWDRDLSTPITDDTVINAEYAVYAFEEVIDDFEAYEDSSELKDEGWTVEKYVESEPHWVETTATISLSANSEEGEKALVLDAWANQVGFRVVKTLETPLTKSANAIKFRVMAPSSCEVKVTMATIELDIPLAGKMSVPFTYSYELTSSDYVEYTIPFNSDKWQAWQLPAADKTLPYMAEALGMSEDDIGTILGSVNFFFKGNNDGKEMKAFVDSVSFVTVDPAEFNERETLGLKKTYTGKTLSDNVLKIDVNDDLSATATVIDVETPVPVPGHIAVNGREAVFTSDDGGVSLVYTGRITNHGNKIEFVSATGAFAPSVADMDLDAVQVVNNFEQYSSSGTGYYYDNTPAARSGMRADFFCDYYKDGDATRPNASPWNPSDPNWHLSIEALNYYGLKTDLGHNSSKSMYLQADGWGRATRFFTYGIFDGTSDKNAFRGSTFSFWAKVKDGGTLPQIIVRVFARSNPDRNSLDTYAVKETYSAVDYHDWKHYEIALNPNLVYYGFQVYLKEASYSGANTFLYVDDIEVYNASPYATYVAPEPETYDLPAGMTYLGKWNYQRAVNIEIIDSENAKISMPSEDLSVNGTYVRDNEDNVAFTFDDTSTLNVKVADDDKTLQFVSATGNSTTIGQYLYGIDYHMLDYADNAETYEKPGTMYYQGNKDESKLEGARGAYYCEYQTNKDADSTPVGGSKWNYMGGSGDQLGLDEADGVDGTKSLLMKYSSAGHMRYMQWELFKGTATAKTGFNKFGFWLKNKTANQVKLIVSVYKVAQVTSSNVSDDSKRAKSEKIILAGNTDWTFYTVPLNPESNYYGFAVWCEQDYNSKSGQINFDKAFYYNDYESPDNYYFASTGFPLSGTIKPGAASIEFKASGAVDLTCEALGGTISGKYSMVMDGETQMLTITMSSGISGTITGTFVASLSGHLTFTVTEATGGFETLVDPATVFTTAS